MRFFDTNFLAKYQGGTASSSSGYEWNAFNENPTYVFVSDAQDTDGDLVFIEREVNEDLTVNRIFIQETNIANLSIQYMKDGDLVYTTLLPTDYNLIESADGRSKLYELNVPLVFKKMRFEGSNTTPANEEKTVSNIFMFNEIGKMLIHKSVSPERQRIQKKLELEAGGTVIANKGFYWKITVSIDGNNLPEDTATFNKLRDMHRNFFIWINDNHEEAFTVFQEPYRFQDLVKVAVYGKNKFEYHDNYFGHGFKDKITLYEAGKEI